MEASLVFLYSQARAKSMLILSQDRSFTLTEITSVLEKTLHRFFVFSTKKHGRQGCMSSRVFWHCMTDVLYVLQNHQYQTRQNTPLQSALLIQCFLLYINNLSCVLWLDVSESTDVKFLIHAEAYTIIASQVSLYSPQGNLVLFQFVGFSCCCFFFLRFFFLRIQLCARSVSFQYGAISYCCNIIHQDKPEFLFRFLCKLFHYFPIFIFCHVQLFLLFVHQLRKARTGAEFLKC